jgi:hypothetical protein
VRPGDILIAIDNQPIEGRADVLAIQQHARAGDRHTYTLLRLGSREMANVSLAPMPSGAGLFYYVLAAVGIFTLLVGAAVRARRPTDQATLHFFWLSVAFFGSFTFSFSGKLDRVDWVFYWGDAIAVMVLPPLFVHFALVFPSARTCRLLGDARALAAGGVTARRRARIDARAGRAAIGHRSRVFRRVIALLDRLEYIYLAVSSAWAWRSWCAPCRARARSRSSASCAGSCGARALARLPFALATRFRSPSAPIPRSRWACRRSRWASSRSRLRPRSSAIA